MSAIRFKLDLRESHTHYAEIEATFHGVAELSELIVRLPVWSPGSYLVREYAQHISAMKASADDGRARSVKKIDKSSWRIDCRDSHTITLKYRVYGHDLGVRNNHFDGSHAFVTPAATFVYVDERLHEAIEVDVVAPPNWKTFTGLKRPVESKAFFVASDFDQLYDCPLEVGPHESFDLEILGRPHRFVTWGKGNIDFVRLKEHLPKLVEANAEIFGGELPYENYTTIILLTDNLYGGLEHKNSTALMYPRFEFESGKSLDAPIEDDSYINFLSLFAHEHFHVWHVKRIRPERLGPFDYQRENLTRDIWTIEGITSYYNDVTLLRANLISPKKFLDMMAQNIKRMETIPGRFVESVEESSFNAWIGIYRPHENSVNASVSYYLKGAIVAALIDIYIRTESQGEKSLDDVLRYLWQHHAKDRGYPEGALESIIEESTGVNMGDVFDTLVRGTQDPDYTDYLEGVGLELSRKHKGEPGPWLGVDLKESGGSVLVSSVRADGPAHGLLSPGDELLAIGGFRQKGTDLKPRLKLAGLNEVVNVLISRRDEIIEVPLVVRQEPPTEYEIRMREGMTSEVRELLVAWLGGLPVVDAPNTKKVEE